MRFPIETTPEDLLLFARECIEEFMVHQEPQQLVVARRAMLRLSKHTSDPGYWTDRFAEQLQELELCSVAGGHMQTFQQQCHQTLIEVGSLF